MSTLAVGIALILGLSLALLEWANHIAAVPAAAYALAFPLLLLVASRSAPATTPARAEGFAWMALAVAIELFAVVTSVDRLGRLAIPFGIIGFLRFTGTAALAPAALALFVVPVPHAFVAIAPLDAVWFAFAEAWIGPAGSQLRVDEWDSGVRLVALFAGLGWYADARAGRSWQGAFRRGAELAMLGLPVQLTAIVLAVGMARAGAPTLGRLFLTYGVWMLCVAVTVFVIERSLAQSAREELSHV